MTGSTPLQRDLARGILDLLRERGARPGERLSRPALAEALGVSRTPVAAALALLEDLGAVRRDGRAILLERLDLNPPAPSGAEEGADRVLVAIARGRADGTVPDEVSERQLSQTLGVGRGVVALALTQLAEAGVATRNRGHGWRFAPAASPSDRAASYRFRMLLEPAALLEPGFALPPGFVERMRRDHARFSAALWTDEQAVAFFRMNAAFHLGLAEASGNRFIAAAVAQQNRFRMLSNTAWRLGPERVEVSVREHLAILDTLVSGERERAALLMRLHLADALALRPGG
jgi:DNA-binding GntR family transcriptional regulator